MPAGLLAAVLLLGFLPACADSSDSTPPASIDETTTSSTVAKPSTDGDAAEPAGQPPWPPELEQAIALIAQQDFAAAGALVRAYRDEQPDVAAGIFVSALILHKQQRYAEARPLFKETLDRDPRQINAHHFLGYCCYYLGDLPAAIAAFEAHLRAAPAAGDSLHGLGIARADAGDRDGAIEALRAAVDLAAARTPPALVPKTRYRLAQLLLESGAIDEAQHLLEHTIQNAPAFAPAYFTLSQIYDRKGMGDLAGRFLDQYERMTTPPTDDAVEAGHAGDAVEVKDQEPRAAPGTTP
jgi:tetratricopeptide (TPR) repeat protein